MGRVTRAAAALILVILAGACSSSSDDGSSASTASSATPSPDTTVADTTPDTTPDPTPDTTTEPATSDAPTTEAPPTDTAAPTLPVTDPPSSYPAQSPDVPYPTLEWPIGELPDGVDMAALDAAVATAFGADDADARVRSLLVVKRGEIVYERYHPLDSADEATSSFSVAKSFTSAIVGMLIGDGRLELEAPAPVEEWQAEGDPRREITLEDLLRMSSGLEWEEVYTPGSIVLEMLQAPHAAEIPISQELAVEPGTEWEYSTGTTAIIAEIAADELGGGDALDTYVHERLLDPLGMTSTMLFEDSTGTWLGGLGADSTPRDFAKFGLLFLRDGVWDGERILPEGWVDASRSPSSTNSSYGLQWWIDEQAGTFAALGLFGQQIIVSPELDLVIVTTSTAGGDPYTLTNTVRELFASAV
ncbi:MAG TPA: serine hydrolase [Ilumatobacteraceae bacterium]|nr:serine hydrolase [Ilumatobacteraceae bacterium]